MKKYLLKRFPSLILVLLGISTLTFLIAHISPVDSAEVYVRKTSLVPNEAMIEKVREEMGLNKPLGVQYLEWLKSVLRFDFGTSYISKQPVLQEFKRTFPLTLKLVAFAVGLILVISIPLGIISAVYKNKLIDHLIRIVSLIGVSVPNYVIGYLLIYLLGVRLKILPLMGEGSIKHIIMPAFTLAIPIISSYIRVLRVNMLENMNTDYVRYARARGIGERLIILKHVFINAILPMITILGQTIAYMMAGTAIVETIFSWPGIGQYCITAINNRDFPVVKAYVLLLAAMFVLCNLLSDTINIAINPRILKENGEL